MIKKLLILLLATATVPVHALDGMSVEAGEGNDTTILKLAVQQTSGFDNPFLKENNLLMVWEANVAEIEQRKFQNVQGQRRDLIDFGLTPVVRWQPDPAQGIFAEIGIGVHYFTETYDNARRLFGSDFQFGDHAGLGYRFNRHVDVTVKFQHYSDADIKKPNPGLNVGMLKISCSF